MTMAFPIAEKQVPYLDTEQMAEVDRAMVEDFGIDLVQMMENAGRNLAHLARVRFLGGDPRDKRVTILAGTGGNGGGALVCARRIHNYGAKVRVFVTRSDDRFSPVPAHQLRILRCMRVPIDVGTPVHISAGEDLIVDGLMGYGLKGAPRGTAADMIRWANAQSVPILALDTPSGVDTTNGKVFEPAIRAMATMTLALPKEGLRVPRAARRVGELYLADISVPPALYAGPGLGIKVGPLFAESDIIRLPSGAD
jgi:NAD(P)H-hydrate epimerase